MKIPGTLAVMALPGAVLFPGPCCPSISSEPRYRKMLADALAGGADVCDRVAPFGADDEADVCEVGGADFVRACVAQSRRHLAADPAGRESRVRYCEWLPGEPYRSRPGGTAGVRVRHASAGGKPARGGAVNCASPLLKGNAKPIGSLLDSAGDHARNSAISWGQISWRTRGSASA